MRCDGKALLEGLHQVPWQVVARTYGNSHATLIGLLVQWWIAAAPATHWALEGGPSFSSRPKGVGGGICDAMFCERDDAVGVLEVEGTRGRDTAIKIGGFFAAEYPSLRTLQFGLLLLYAYEPRGSGAKRALPPAADLDTRTAIAQVAQSHPEKSLIVITLDKVYERQTNGIRSRNEYYQSRLSIVHGYLYEQGQQTAARLLYGAAPADQLEQGALPHAAAS